MWWKAQTELRVGEHINNELIYLVAASGFRDGNWHEIVIRLLSLREPITLPGKIANGHDTDPFPQASERLLDLMFKIRKTGLLGSQQLSVDSERCMPIGTLPVSTSHQRACISQGLIAALIRTSGLRHVTLLRSQRIFLVFKGRFCPLDDE
ncbi:hypothetical protein FJZ48_00880 [Candidatus Uhrbacteria bacterium]|nr:hypothetical protein [Candidatus Uhrbacteria bacterium]